MQAGLVAGGAGGTSAAKAAVGGDNADEAAVRDN